jgi:MFS family permease
MTGALDRAQLSRPASAALLLGAVLNPINSSLIAVALIPIGLAFDVGPGVTAWLVTSLYLTTAIGQPVAGYLIDRFGARPLFLTGTVLVGIGGTLGAIAPDIPTLIVARVVIGLGTCAGYPAAMWLIRSTRDDGAPPARRLLTALAIAGQVSAVVGPAFGGLLVGVGGWRLIFVVNLPLAIGTFALAAVYLPRIRIHRLRSTRIDVVGIVPFSLTLGAFVALLMGAQPAWLTLGALVAFALVFVGRELRAPDPFLDVRLVISNRPLAATFLRQLLAFAAFYSFYYGYVQWLEEGRALAPALAGLVVLPMAASAVFMALLSGRFLRFGVSISVGSVALVVASLGLLRLGAESGLPQLVIAAVLFGIPQGLNGLANQMALY